MQFQSMALMASFRFMQRVARMMRAPHTAARCMGKALGAMAMTTSTANRVTTEMMAFFLSRGFFSVWANSGT